MIFLGIDPGLDGGMAFLDDESQTLSLFKTPVIAGKDYDIQEIKNLLVSFHPSMVTVEAQIALPGQGLSSTLQTGKGFGILLGLLAGLEIPYQVIGAKQWQNKLFTGVSAKLDTKDKSAVIAKRLFPKADFRRSERATKANDGLTDAACIAEYGRRTYSIVHDPVTGFDHESLPENPDVCLKCGGYIPTIQSNNCIR